MPLCPFVWVCHCASLAALLRYSLILSRLRVPRARFPIVCSPHVHLSRSTLHSPSGPSAHCCHLRVSCLFSLSLVCLTRFLSGLASSRTLMSPLHSSMGTLATYSLASYHVCAFIAILCICAWCVASIRHKLNGICWRLEMLQKLLVRPSQCHMLYIIPEISSCFTRTVTGLPSPLHAPIGWIIRPPGRFIFPLSLSTCSVSMTCMNCIFIPTAAMNEAHIHLWMHMKRCMSHWIVVREGVCEAYTECTAVCEPRDASSVYSFLLSQTIVLKETVNATNYHHGVITQVFEGERGRERTINLFSCLYFCSLQLPLEQFKMPLVDNMLTVTQAHYFASIVRLSDKWS